MRAGDASSGPALHRSSPSDHPAGAADLMLTSSLAVAPTPEHLRYDQQPSRIMRSPFEAEELSSGCLLITEFQNTFSLGETE